MADPEESRSGDRLPVTCGDSPGEEQGRYRAGPESCKHSRHANLVNQGARTVPSPVGAISLWRPESSVASLLRMVAARHASVADCQRKPPQLDAPALPGGRAQVTPQFRQ